MKMNFAIGMGRNERMDEIAELARLADEHGFTHATFVDEPYLARDVHVMATRANSDFKRAGGRFSVKTTDQVFHERMAERPFVPLESFGVAEFVDMGKKHFDSHTDGCSREALPAPKSVVP